MPRCGRPSTPASDGSTRHRCTAGDGPRRSSPRPSTGVADRPLVFTKCGTLRAGDGSFYTDNSPAAVRGDVEASLRRLGVERARPRAGPRRGSIGAGRGDVGRAPRPRARRSGRRGRALEPPRRPARPGARGRAGRHRAEPVLARRPVAGVRRHAGVVRTARRGVPVVGITRRRIPRRRFRPVRPRSRRPSSPAAMGRCRRGADGEDPRGDRHHRVVARLHDGRRRPRLAHDAAVRLPDRRGAHTGRSGRPRRPAAGARRRRPCPARPGP